MTPTFKNPFTVLSLFDGISCGHLALDRAEIPITKYYASEIDKYAIKITQENFPETIQLGDITKWREWGIDRPDIIIGGSPCQGFSFAGKQLNFDDPRSKLFFEFAAIVKHYKPKYFLLENVKMKKESEAIITETLGVKPIEINSALVSAQNRKRLYWTNIPNVTQPEDKGILLVDILESGSADRDKSYCIDANYYKGGSLKNYLEKKRRQLCMAQSEKRLMVSELKSNYRVDAPTNLSSDKFPTLRALAGGKTKGIGITDNITWRKLTPIECERLQTLPDNYTYGVSNTQRYKAIGNGWTVDVLAHIFKSIEVV